MYLIVGANGFLGSYLIKNILEKTNDKILATDLICPKNINNRVEWFKCDITNLNDLNNLYAKTKKEKFNQITFLQN